MGNLKYGQQSDALNISLLDTLEVGNIRPNLQVPKRPIPFKLPKPLDAIYIMRTGTADPNLDTYFSWPGFFVLSAFVTQVAGYQSILSYAGWAPVFNNLIYVGPMYMIFTSFTTDKRLIWLGLWFFYLTNWIGQDYFSPQGLNFFLYLVIIAILLKWFKIPPKALPLVPWQRGQSRVRFPQ